MVNSLFAGLQLSTPIWLVLVVHGFSKSTSLSSETFTWRWTHRSIFILLLLSYDITLHWVITYLSMSQAWLLRFNIQWKIEHFAGERGPNIHWTLRWSSIYFAHSLPTVVRWRLRNDLQGHAFDIETERHRNRFKIGFFLRCELMNFESCLDLLWSHLLASSVLAIYPDTLLKLGGLHQMARTILACEWQSTGLLPRLPFYFAIREARLIGNLSVFLYLLLCVPEPLINLIFLQVKLIWETCNLLSRWCISLKLLVKFPKSVLLALGLTSTVSFPLFSGLFLCCLRGCAVLFGRRGRARLRPLYGLVGKRGFILIWSGQILPLQGLGLGFLVTFTGRIWGLRRYSLHWF